MSDKSDKERLENPPNSPSENSSDEIIPASHTVPINQVQETENMEVHKHPHHVTHKKKWSEYLLEFFMLFLAVFLGFIAENQREHFVEQQREKKFARRLLSDLRQDSIFFETRIRALEKGVEAYKQFLIIMTSPALATDSAINREFVSLLLAGTSNDFTTATYNQMKTSGSLRYIANDNLTTLLQKYYDVLLAKASRDADGASIFFTNYIISYMTKHFRFQDFKPTEGSAIHTKLLNRSAESDQELINIMGVWDSHGDTQLKLLRPAQQQMLELISLIKKEYHLE